MSLIFVISTRDNSLQSIDTNIGRVNHVPTLCNFVRELGSDRSHHYLHSLMREIMYRITVVFFSGWRHSNLSMSTRTQAGINPVTTSLCIENSQISIRLMSVSTSSRIDSTQRPGQKHNSSFAAISSFAEQ